MTAPSAAEERRHHGVGPVHERRDAHVAILEEARRAGLLQGGVSEQVSVQVPLALLEAAKQESGISSPNELTILALAMLAQPDPVAAFFMRTEGRLGSDHDLDL